MLKLCMAVLVAVLLLAVPEAAGGDLRGPAFQKEVQKVFDQVYALDYEAAASSLRALKEQYPKHPAPPLYQATVVWLRELFERQELDLGKFISPSYFDRPTVRRMPAGEHQAFLDLIEESEKLTREILREDPRNKDARYFLGSAEGVLASFSITIDRSRGKAFKHGKRAYKIHHSLVQQDPDYYDAYMSVGIYEYVVGKLPWYIKWLASLAGYHGSVKRGFQYLQRAAEKGSLVADDARVMQMVLYVREGQFQKALENVLYLERKAPKNFLFQLNHAQILEKLGRLREALDVYKRVLSFAEEKRPNFQLLPIATIRYTVASRFLELQRAHLALDQFQKVLADSATEREQALSRLKSGQALDLLGRRNDAVVAYEQVLQLPDVENSHRQAKKYLKKSYLAP
ncbi:MAG: tetratricopeptide repeat protein [Acidobacteriota bacterium]